MPRRSKHGGNTVYVQAGIWWNEKTGIHITVKDAHGFHTTVRNDPKGKRGHPNLFYKLATCLCDAGAPHPPIPEDKSSIFLTIAFTHRGLVILPDNPYSIGGSDVARVNGCDLCQPAQSEESTVRQGLDTPEQGEDRWANIVRRGLGCCGSSEGPAHSGRANGGGRNLLSYGGAGPKL